MFDLISDCKFCNSLLKYGKIKAIRCLDASLDISEYFGMGA